jgi:hypothetical protein
MTARTLAGGGYPERLKRVIPWPDAIQRRRRGGGRHGRCRRQATGRIVLWPHRYWPQRPEDLHQAVICSYRLHCAGLLDDIEMIVREAEAAAMRGWIK